MSIDTSSNNRIVVVEMSFILPDECADPVLDLLTIKDIVVLYCIDRKTRSYLDVRYPDMTSYVLKRLDSLCCEDLLYVSVVFEFGDRVKSILPIAAIDVISSVCRHMISLGRLDMLKSVSKTGEIATFKYNNWRFAELIKDAVLYDRWEMLCYIFIHIPLVSRPEAYHLACNHAIRCGNKKMLKDLITSNMYDKNNMRTLSVLIATDDIDIFNIHSTELFYTCVGYCIAHDRWKIFEDLVAASIENDQITDRIMEVVHEHVPRSLARSLQRFVDTRRVMILNTCK